MVTEGDASADLEKATLAGGCFWCTEAVFQRLRGVKEVVPGYAGGETDDPSYAEVVTGQTGHAEAIQISYDPAVISFETLLDVFWRSHNPTTLNRQGNDVGPQYRSAIFYHNEGQKKSAEESKRSAEESGRYDQPIVTEITPLTKFYEAETYHHDFYNKNPDRPYCQVVIDPKIKKLYKEFPRETR